MPALGIFIFFPPSLSSKLQRILPFDKRRKIQYVRICNDRQDLQTNLLYFNSSHSRLEILLCDWQNIAEQRELLSPCKQEDQVKMSLEQCIRLTQFALVKQIGNDKIIVVYGVAPWLLLLAKRSPRLYCAGASVGAVSVQIALYHDNHV